MKSLNADICRVEGLELLLLYLQSSSFVRCVRNIMGILQYVVAIAIYGGACP